MSWTFNTTEPVSRYDIPFDEMENHQTLPVGCTFAYTDQFNAAIAAVSHLLDGVGLDEDLVTVSMSGHANPRHSPVDGWSDEFITVTVRQKLRSPDDEVPEIRRISDLFNPHFDDDND